MDFRELREFILDSGKYIIAAVIAILIFMYIISFQQVVGPSMNPTFSEGNLVLVDKLQYKIGKIKRGDVLVFEHAGLKNLIKRVIGVPGDKVEYINNVLYINGNAYEEKYLAEGTITTDFKSSDIGEETIPDDMYLVLGDNRSNSQDSRSIGYIKKDQIVGKVVLRFWPLNQIKIF